MKMDGADVVKGDSVYSTGKGPGRVIEVSRDDKYMRVKFDERGMIMAFNDKGFHARDVVRSLYWFNPVMVAPPKDSVRWDKLRHVVSTAATTLLEVA